ncbi:MAG TPA: hypothetical protein VFF06_23045 [Polyangia bacterium]|nr:hypothetical protein [Polyangia bacterium]
MGRLQAFLGGMCMLVLALGPAVAEAQPMPENNPQACHDGVDNDGNGYVDCYDQQCAPFCQQGYGQPPPQYGQPYGQPPPPPQYYAAPPPPPPVYVIRPRAPSSGLGALVTGAILLPLGIIFVAVSIPLWNSACGAGSFCANDPLGHPDDYNNAVGAAILDVIGVPFIIAGLILIPVGAARYARFRRWRDRQGVALYDHHGLTIEPIIGGAPSIARSSSSSSLASGSLGLKLTF